MNRVLMLVLLIWCGVSHHAAAETHLVCNLETPAHGTFCETDLFGLDPDISGPLEAELDAILSEPPGNERGEYGDLTDPDVYFCMLVSDDRLGRAFDRNKSRAEALIERLIDAGAFAACRTQPEYVLLMLERQEQSKQK